MEISKNYKLFSISSTDFLVKILIFITWFACIFDPNGSLFGVKYISMIFLFIYILLFFLFSKYKFSIRSPSVIMVFFLVILMPVYGLILSVIRGGAVGNFIDTSYIISGFFILFYFVLVTDRLFKFSISVFILLSTLLSVLIIFVFISSGSSVGDLMYVFFVDKGIAFISTRKYFGVDLPYIYFITSPLLCLLICCMTFKVCQNFSIINIAILLISISALFLSGTRMNMILSVFCVFYTIMWYVFGKRAYLYIFLAFISSVLTIIVNSDNVLNNDFLSVNDTSNSTKIGYLNYYFEWFSSIPNFFFGQGYNAQIWSEGLRNHLVEGASKLEITYLELVRVYGVIVAFSFVFIIFYLVFNIKYDKFNENNWLHPALITYLIVSSLNPYLFSMYGMMALSLSAAYISVYQRRVK